MSKKRVVLLGAMTVVLLVAAQAAMAQKPKRITFKRGASSATVSGRIAGNGYLEYLINGRSGQLMSIDITSGNGKVIVNAGTASGKNFSLDMSGGDHLLSIVNSGKTATTFTLRVSIKY
jgi:opacity protein-like surface antigen